MVGVLRSTLLQLRAAGCNEVEPPAKRAKSEPTHDLNANPPAQQQPHRTSTVPLAPSACASAAGVCGGPGPSDRAGQGAAGQGAANPGHGPGPGAGKVVLSRIDQKRAVGGKKGGRNRQQSTTTSTIKTISGIHNIINAVSASAATVQPSSTPDARIASMEAKIAVLVEQLANANATIVRLNPAAVAGAAAMARAKGAGGSAAAAAEGDAISSSSASASLPSSLSLSLPADPEAALEAEHAKRAQIEGKIRVWTRQVTRLRNARDKKKMATTAPTAAATTTTTTTKPKIVKTGKQPEAKEAAATAVAAATATIKSGAGAGAGAAGAGAGAGAGACAGVECATAPPTEEERKHRVEAKGTFSAARPRIESSRRTQQAEAAYSQLEV